MTDYIRPLVQIGPVSPEGAYRLAGGWAWFTHIERLSREGPPVVLPAGSLSEAALARLTAPRAAIAGLDFERPRVMGILNVTPDSFSDGGRHDDLEAAVSQARQMMQSGADIIDIGGESTRPGAQFVAPDEESLRTAPVIAALRARGLPLPISIDTRKAEVAQAALKAGADVVNDVSGFTFDPALVPLCAQSAAPVCIMHAQGDPATMQDDPQYKDVLLDVYDFLHARIKALSAAGIPQHRIIADPGIGFGKTRAHNLALLHRISLFHSLGVPILLGASRKRFIGTIGGEKQADKRGAGSVGVALAAVSQGVQLLRVHDVFDHVQAVALWGHSMKQDW